MDNLQVPVSLMVVEATEVIMDRVGEERVVDQVGEERIMGQVVELMGLVEAGWEEAGIEEAGWGEKGCEEAVWVAVMISSVLIMTPTSMTEMEPGDSRPWSHGAGSAFLTFLTFSGHLTALESGAKGGI
jgi:hypothetical protein